MYRRLVFLAGIIISIYSSAQPIKYSSANAHSHNNYVQPVVFWDAYKLQYGSIEADIYLAQDSADLWVAHNRADLEKEKKSLASLYLEPLVTCIRKNNGYVYPDRSLTLQLMIDIKTEAGATLRHLIQMITRYPELTNTSTLKIVISGNRPDPSLFVTYPSFIWFDGEAGKNYTTTALAKIAMISAPLKNYTKWNGDDVVAKEEDEAVKKIVRQVHELKKPIRFWGAPDNIDAWKILMKWQVDYINTDHVAELAQFIESLPLKNN